MRFVDLSTGLLGAASVAAGYPGMRQTMSQLMSIQKRAPEPRQLLGDLVYLPFEELTHVGRHIRAILLLENTNGGGQDLATIYEVPGPLNSPECAAETCCVWKYIADEMAADFGGSSGRCNMLARQAVRLGFHDAGTWSKEGGGGADGSFVLANEIQRPLNAGLEEINEKMKEYYSKWNAYGASMADLIQMGANVGAVVCPMGPRVRSFVGRNDSSTPAPEGRLPAATQDVEELLELFEAKTIDRGDLITLLGAHSVGQQRFEDPARSGDPHDTTPGVWDAIPFYEQTVSNDTAKRIFKFHSDVSVATYPDSLPLWGLFATPDVGQSFWNDVSIAIPAVDLGILTTRLGLRHCLRPPESPWCSTPQQPGRVHWRLASRHSRI